MFPYEQNQNIADLLTGSWPTNISLSLTRMCTADAVHGSYCYPLYRSETIAITFIESRTRSPTGG